MEDVTPPVDELSKELHPEVTTELGKNTENETLEKRRNAAQPDAADGKKEKLMPRRVNLQQLVTEAASEDPAIQYRAVKAVWKVINVSTKRDTLINSLIRCGILPILVNCLRTKTNPFLQSEATRALTNIASGTSLQTQAVVDAGAGPLLLELLSSPHEEVCGEAVVALGNIIGDGARLRDYVISLGIVAPLLNFIVPNIPTTFLRNVTRVIVNLCRWKDPPLPIETLKDILPALQRVLVHQTDASVLVDAACAISCVIEAEKDRIQMVVRSGVIPNLVNLLSHEDDKLRAAVVHAVGNIVTGTDEQTQAVLDCDALKHFPTLLTHHDAKICKKALWFLSNITAGNHAQIQSVIDTNLTPLIINHLKKVEFQTQKEAAWALGNMMINGNKKQAAYLVNVVGVIPPLCGLLNSEDSKVIEIVIDAIYYILEKSSKVHDTVCKIIKDCGSAEKIDSLQKHENEDISRPAYEINMSLSFHTQDNNSDSDNDNFYFDENGYVLPLSDTDSDEDLPPRGLFLFN